MFRLLVAYDGSESSDKALGDLSRAGLPEEADALVLTVSDPRVTRADFPDYPFGLSYAAPEDTARLSADEAIEASARGKTKLQALFPAWHVTSKFVSGSAFEGITAGIEFWRPDLVTMGSRGRSAVGRLFFGSVSHQVLTRTHCNLRICRDRGETGREDRPLRVVVAYDGSQEAEIAFETVLSRSWPPGTSVRLLTALDMRVLTAFLRPAGPVRYWITDTDRKPTAWIDRMLSCQKKRLEEKGLAAHAWALRGDARRELLREAESWKADLIVAGCRGLTGRRKIVAGSVSTALAMQARCSVEIVHRLWDSSCCCDQALEEHRSSMTRGSGTA